MAGTRRRPGRMGPFVESYRVVLLAQGYTPLTVRGVLQHVGCIGPVDGGRGPRGHDVCGAGDGGGRLRVCCAGGDPKPRWAS
jgi:hypothetical protein